MDWSPPPPPDPFEPDAWMHPVDREVMRQRDWAFGNMAAEERAGQLTPPASDGDLVANQAFLREQREVRERRMREWVDVARSHLASIKDPVERLIVAVHAGTNSWTVVHSGRPTFAVDWDLVRLLLPDLPATEPKPYAGAGRWARSGRDRPTARWRREPSYWDHDAVHTWFMEHVRSPPTHDQLLVTTMGLFGERSRRRRGWLFAEGSTLVHPKHGRPGTIAVLTDGRRVYPGSNSWLKSGELGDGYNALALTHMATLAGLRVLPSAPQRPETA